MSVRSILTSAVCLTLVLATLLLLVATVSSASEPGTSPPTSAVNIADSRRGGSGRMRASFKLPKLFSFAHFKKLFRKTYSGLIERTVRYKLFLSRALRAFVSAIKHKYRKSKFYLAVNSMSDATPQELDIQRNKVLSEIPLRPDPVKKTTTPAKLKSGPHTVEPLPQFNLITDEKNITRQLSELVQRHGHKPGFKELAQEMIVTEDHRALEQRRRGRGRTSRNRRDVSNAQPEKLIKPQVPKVPKVPRVPRVPRVRDISLDKLIKTGQDVKLSPGAAAKARLKLVKSNNPLYEPIELPSRGFADKIEDLKLTIWKKEPDEENVGGSSVGEQLESSLETIEPDYMDIDSGNADVEPPEEVSNEPDLMDIDSGNAEEQLPDEVFYDARVTNCFTLPRNQGTCGSCYAFATIAMMEWYFCMAAQRLEQFSEQYIIDCGKGHIEGISGCEGGWLAQPVMFVHNFGMELLKNFPYLEQDGQCPYGEQTDRNKMGFWRAKLDNLLEVHVDDWPAILPSGPMYVGIYLADGFHEYGGGVHGWNCDKDKRHAVVVIGHGREDNVEYWLIRNSYGTGWGEAGYYKLAKDADCVFFSTGYKFATVDGRNYKFLIEINKNKDVAKEKD